VLSFFTVMVTAFVPLSAWPAQSFVTVRCGVAHVSVALSVWLAEQLGKPVQMHDPVPVSSPCVVALHTSGAVWWWRSRPSRASSC
jgi:hypothetical protein